MPRYNDDELEELKRRIDLAALVRSRGVELKATGNGSLMGKCPFHEDDKPSFGVTPAKGLWHCLGCGAAGNAIQFLMKKDGLSFRHAVELLRTQSAAIFAATPATAPKLPAPVAPDADDQTLLRQVTEYYHKRLKESPPALAYLQKRGVTADAVDTFKLGYADRTLGLTLLERNRKDGVVIRERLAKLGIIRAESGHEHLNGCVVFPILGPQSEVLGLYGRKIYDNLRPGTAYHLYLPGPHRGLWNAGCLASPQVILCEAILDALAFYCAGYRNVTAAYGAEGFTEEMENAIVASKVERVLLAHDRDAAGDRGAAKAAERLMGRGVECWRVLFPPGQDANEYARKVTPAHKSLGVLLNAAQWMGKGQAGAVRPVVKAEPSPVGTVPPVAESAPARVPASASSLTALAAKTDRAGDAKNPPLPALPPEEKPEAVKVKMDTQSPATLPPPLPAVAVDVVKNEPDETVLVLGDREYRVRGLAKNTGFESLRVALRVKCAERWHLDTLDLCSARQRQSYIEAAAMETGLKADLLKRDLGRVLLKLEELHEARLRAQVEAAPAGPAMTAEERTAAMELLQDPKLLDRLLADFAACGVVGEENNKLVAYLATVSRKLDQPLAVIMQSTSAAGKTALMEAALAFVPPEDRVKYSALTGQALYYLGDADLKNKILAIVEEEGAERASYALKLLQSEGELTIASTGKDPHTGRMVTQEYRVEGPVMIFLTTTAADLDEELLNRCLVLTVDEGREQTAAIHRLQRERESLAGLLRNDARARLLATHRTAQRLLRPLPVVNPFAAQLTFRDDRTRSRRDHMKYLILIRTIALLHQYQRPIKTVTQGERTLAYIEATADDVAAANRLAHEVLGRCLDDMPPQTRRLLDLLDGMAREACAKRKIGRSDWLFSRRDVRERTGWSDTQLRVHLDRLTALEYLIVHRGGRGQSFVYELAYDGGGQHGGRFLPGLLDVEKLREPRAYDADRAGSNGHLTGEKDRFAGSKRPQNGAGAAGSRPPEKPAAPSENHRLPPKPRKNTHPGGPDAAA
jgi:DNA primase catalytic core